MCLSGCDLAVLHHLRIIDFICNLYKDDSKEAKEAVCLKREHLRLLPTPPKSIPLMSVQSLPATRQDHLHLNQRLVTRDDQGPITLNPLHFHSYSSSLCLLASLISSHFCLFYICQCLFWDLS